MLRRDMGVTWKEASAPGEREAVFSFRYEEYFAEHTGLPGVDSARRRVALPHDMHSRHIMAIGPDGSLLAVGTITPASEQSIAQEWKDIFHFARIAPLLAETVIISRVVVSAAARGSSLFGQMILRLAAAAIQSGFHCSVHYCAPRMISLYERMGYRCYGTGGEMGLSFRVPMILSIDAAEDLRRAGSPIAPLLTSARTDETCLQTLLSLCPELTETPLCLLDPPAFRRRIASLCPLLADAPPDRLRPLRRAGVFRMPKGLALARTGQDEGEFLLLRGELDEGERRIIPCTAFRSGASLLKAAEDSLLASIPSNKRGRHVECSYQ